ncbi:hypothetical protein HDV06_000364 [Boothiomyces sp. JEL0866]|nr:hypothetical protein HDV06_000364 [Boothiomyces sp. JEL0866]
MSNKIMVRDGLAILQKAVATLGKFGTDLYFSTINQPFISTVNSTNSCFVINQVDFDVADLKIQVKVLLKPILNCIKRAERLEIYFEEDYIVFQVLFNSNIKKYYFQYQDSEPLLAVYSKQLPNQFTINSKFLLDSIQNLSLKAGQVILDFQDNVIIRNNTAKGELETCITLEKSEFEHIHCSKGKIIVDYKELKKILSAGELLTAYFQPGHPFVLTFPSIDFVMATFPDPDLQPDPQTQTSTQKSERNFKRRILQEENCYDVVPDSPRSKQVLSLFSQMS